MRLTLSPTAKFAHYANLCVRLYALAFSQNTVGPPTRGVVGIRLIAIRSTGVSMSITLPGKAIITALVSTTALASASFAQDQNTDVIVVTVQKAEQARIDVPINVTAFNERFLDQVGIGQFDELSDFVPGFEVQEQSPNTPGFVIRGITSDNGGAGEEPRVAVFQDGVSISKSRGSYVELFDIERVEVAKGPQPTLFGRGALIGGVNIVQNKAGYDFAAEAEVGYGNENYQLAQGFVNIPLVEDTAALRLAGIYKTRDGYVDNALGGEDFMGVGTAAVRGSLRLDPTQSLTIDVIANYQNDDTPGTAFRTGNPFLDASTSPFDPASLNTFGGFEGGMDLGVKREVWGLTTIADYTINDTLSLTSITGYREFDSNEVFDPDGFVGELIVAGENAQGDQFSQEVRLNFDTQARLRGFVGANYFWEDGFQRVPLAANEAAAQQFLGGFLFNPTLSDATALATAQGLVAAAGIDPTGLNIDQLNGILVAGGLPAVVLDDPTNPYPINLTLLGMFGVYSELNPFYLEEATNFAETTSYDLFGDVTYDLTEAFSLTAGIRWTYDRKKVGAQADNAGVQSNLTLERTLFVPATPNGERIETSDEFDDFTYRLVGAYRVSDDLNTWASYARGRRPEVISFDTDADDNFALVPAETVDSFEVGGFANLFGGTTQLNASAFYSTYENFQTTVFLPATASFITTNAGEATQYGLEGEVFSTLTDWADVFVTYGYNFAQFDGDGLEYDGNAFRLNPEHALSVGGQFTWDMGDLGAITLVPTYSWQSEIFFDNNNDNDIADGDGGATGVPVDEIQDAYGLANIRLRFDNASDRYALELFVTNALDEDYIIDAGNTGDSFGIPTFIAGAPRLYGASLRARF